MSEVSLTLIGIGVFVGTALLLVAITWWYASTLPDGDSEDKKSDEKQLNPTANKSAT